DGEVHRLALRPVDGFYVHGRYEPRCDERPAKIVDLRSIVAIAGIEARDLPDMPGAEQRPTFDEDLAELAHALGFDGLDEGRRPRLMIDDDVQLADIGKGIA